MIETSDYSDAQANSLKKLNTQHIFWMLIAFIAAQRFALSSISELICVIPFVAALHYFTSNEKIRNSLLFLALFLSVDNAAVGAAATVSVVRYLIYATIILTLALNSSTTKTRLLAMFMVFVLYAMITFTHVNQPLSSVQMWRDIQILTLGGILLVLKNRRAYELDIGLLFYAINGYLLSECVNYVAFSGVWQGDYMSYDTTKYLIAFPSLIAIMAGRPLVAWTLVGLTIMVLVGYTHRTLFLGYLISLVAILAVMPMKKGGSKRIFAIVGIGLAINYVAGGLDIVTFLQSNKALNSLYLLQLYGLSAFQLLDPVRFASSALFFELSTFELLFGRGLGSGLKDNHGLLDFVTLNQTAFSEQELKSNIYFNFHDVWIDVGLRFGLFPLALFFVWLLRMRPVRNLPGTAIWVLAFIGVLSAFYGISGLISIAVLLRVFQSYRASSV